MFNELDLKSLNDFRWWQLKHVFIFTPIPGDSWSNLTWAYFSIGLLKNHPTRISSEKSTNWKGKSVESNLHDLGFQMLIFQGENQLDEFWGLHPWALDLPEVTLPET